MIRYSVYAFVLILAIVALVSPKTVPNAISAPKPTPVGLQYDEISKTAMAPATAPPPGSFHADYVAAMNAPAGQMPEGLDADTIATMQRMGIKIPTGVPGLGGTKPMRYAFYNGWIRVDDLLGKTAEIQKCNAHQFIDLDLDKKTYRISGMSSGLGQSSFGNMNGRNGEQPGTAVMTVSRKAANLGPMTIDGVATTGYDLTNSMSITQATGSCQDATFSSTQTEYVSSIHQPRTFCTLYNPAINASGRATTGGCNPTMHFSGNAGGPPEDRLVMYSRMQTSMGGGMAPAMVTERGNVKWLYQADATALFTIPPEFTQQP